jgi:hypothetical protein
VRTRRCSALLVSRVRGPVPHCLVVEAPLRVRTCCAATSRDNATGHDILHGYVDFSSPPPPARLSRNVFRLPLGDAPMALRQGLCGGSRLELGLRSVDAHYPQRDGANFLTSSYASSGVLFLGTSSTGRCADRESRQRGWTVPGSVCSARGRDRSLSRVVTCITRPQSARPDRGKTLGWGCGRRSFVEPETRSQKGLRETVPTSASARRLPNPIRQRPGPEQNHP